MLTDPDALRLERETSSLLDEQVVLLRAGRRASHSVAQVARETMLALMDPSDFEASTTATSVVVQLPVHAQSKSNASSFQRISGYDEFGNDEVDSLRQTVAELQQQVALLQSELQKQRRSKGGK